jgi:putative DNA primase/helicase
MTKPALTVVVEGAEDDPRPPAFSDDALALRFAERHEQHLRYIDTWGRWMVWNGRRWCADERRVAFNHAREVCREAAAICNKPSVAVALASGRTIGSVEKLAKADPRLAATSDQWDQDPWLLNTPGGVVDLQKSFLRPHQADDYMTHITAVAPAGDCPAFKRFLDRVTDHDGELQGFLQRALGYGLTGSTREHALSFWYGLGANGKSVLLNTAAGIMGDYHKTSPIETFVASVVERHPTDLAGLRGARLVTAVETEEGRRWAESKIKALTGGDPIAARFMRQDFFEFTPQFKLVIAGNHKPGLRSVDEAIRRRLHLVPFAVTIPPDERDPDLSEKLRAEWPGILQWMIDGCRQWQERGLDPPTAVRAATAAYLESEDAFTAWIDEACDREPDAWESSSDLFASRKAWAEKAGEPVGSLKRFSQQLEAKGFVPMRRSYGRGFVGLRLRRTDYTDSPYPERRG